MFTLSLASLGAGTGRQSSLITNASLRPAALVTVKIKTNAIPLPGGKYQVFLLRHDGTLVDDGAGNSDAAIVRKNAPLLGEFELAAGAASGDDYQRTFDTWALGPLGAKWGIAVVNATDQDLAASGSEAGYTTYVPEAQ